MKTALRSHVGKVRQVNEDQAWSGALEDGVTIAIVADGMGGHRAGDVASGLAVDSIVASIQGWKQDEVDADKSELVRGWIRKANEVVFETASLNEQYHNMGTTVVLAIIEGDSGWIGHIGDSRAYRYREGELSQLTEDHTLVNELTKSGQLSPEEAAIHPRRNVLTRALGTDRDVEVDVRSFDWRPGDRLLLCSDGLSGLVEPSLLLQAMGVHAADLDEQADRLIDLALDAGGDDNVTVVLVADDAAADTTGGVTA
ncbi:Stp1/IreP family PP2C-type Ser/Thr phosphatase [Cohnella panacarvi]|uniref:Stp1/IreP family PP2C-type Ser/Thr phosphatase n=1 Tax=Cohnella panacarvi TaxID=400776 RepID=UPI00054ED119|nr:Stp1/IreP family PP2C-type Ser/Thr phosphatase [Cohnella panacarvi]